MFVGCWGKEGDANGDFSKPAGVAVGENGHVFVSERGNHRIQCFDRNGVFLNKWGSYGVAEGQFDCPDGLAISTHPKEDLTLLAAIHETPELRSFPPGVLPICLSYIGEECLYV